VISAHSGLIHYVEGQTFLDSNPVEVKISKFPEMKENMELTTKDGRAEVLLNPGAFLRVGENSSVRMVSNKLSDSRMEFLSGEIVIEADGTSTKAGEDIVTILYKDTAVHVRKSGIYRFDSQPAELRVYSGEAEVQGGGNSLIVRNSRMVALDAPLTAEKFDPKDMDSLSRWSRRRAEYISMANVSAAKYVNDNGGGWKTGGWYFNPYYGMMTYLPGLGIARSPYGFDYYSPLAVYSFYRAPVIRSSPNVGNIARTGSPAAGSAAPASSFGPRTLSSVTSAPRAATSVTSTRVAAAASRK